MGKKHGNPSFEELPKKSEDVQERSETEEFWDVPVADHPEKFIALLKKLLFLADSDFSINESEIIVKLGDRQRRDALMNVLNDAELRCGAIDTEPHPSIKILLPIPESFILEGKKLSLARDPKVALRTFLGCLQNHYSKLIYQNTGLAMEEPPEKHPLYSQVTTYEEMQFLSRMRTVQPMLLELLKAGSPFTQWVQSSQYLEIFEKITQLMLQHLKPFEKQIAEYEFTPTAIASYKIALKNLRENQKLMVNLMRVNPVVFKLLSDSFNFFDLVQSDYQKQTAKMPSVDKPKRPKAIIVTKAKSKHASESEPKLSHDSAPEKSSKKPFKESHKNTRKSHQEPHKKPESAKKTQKKAHKKK
ncbi:MAG: hypothetical protein ACHQJ6_02080 [Candidatus Berkiellales bacterium]